MKFLLLSGILISVPAWAAPAEPDGKLLFTQNCSACHTLDQMLVGPSLVEIRGLYAENPDGFVHWCTSPGKKRPETIEMPSMAHLGEPNLLAIHKYILGATEGVIEQKVSGNDSFAASPTHLARPQVQRIFMPDAGPAAIAVALDGVTSLCWDAGVCRLRYVWTGGFIDGYPYWKGNGNKQAKLIGTVRYVETASPFSDMTPVKFHGYDLVNGLPAFHYTAGNLKVCESFKAVPTGKGIQRNFTLATKPTSPLELHFKVTPEMSITSNHGSLSNGILKLTPDEALDFTLTLVFR